MELTTLDGTVRPALARRMRRPTEVAEESAEAWLMVICWYQCMVVANILSTWDTVAVTASESPLSNTADAVSTPCRLRKSTMAVTAAASDFRCCLISSAVMYCM